MPRISEFYGILITMFYRDHGPPHFHAEYGEHATLIGIDPIVLIGGRVPARQRRLVKEWAALHQAELAENWRWARGRPSPLRIAPLPCPPTGPATG